MTRGGTNGRPWQACSEGISVNFLCADLVLTLSGAGIPDDEDSRSWGVSS